MATVIELERLALDLPEKERATLAAILIESLPGVLSDDDEGLADALQRDAEIEADPAKAIGLAELDSQIQSRVTMRLEPDDLPVTNAERALLNARLADMEDDPDDHSP